MGQRVPDGRVVPSRRRRTTWLARLVGADHNGAGWHLNRLSERSRRIATADAGCQTSRSQRGGRMCLDSLPHGRRSSSSPTLAPRTTLALSYGRREPASATWTRGQGVEVGGALPVESTHLIERAIRRQRLEASFTCRATTVRPAMARTTGSKSLPLTNGDLMRVRQQ